MFFTARHHRNDQRRAKRRAAGFFNRFFISACRHRAFFQQLAEALAPFIGNNEEAPRLQRPVVRRAQASAKDVFQLFARRSRVGQT